MTQFDFNQSSAFHGPEESPGFLLWRASTLWRRALEGILKPFDLTHPQFVILAAVGWLTKEGMKASQAEIGRQAGLDPNTTSQILRSLQAKELIQRTLSKDERSKHPSLTKTGSTLLGNALPAVEKADALFFAAVNLRQMNALHALQILAGFKINDGKKHQMHPSLAASLSLKEKYAAPLSQAIQTEYHKLIREITKIPANSRNEKKLDGPGGPVSVSNWIAYHIGWGRRVLAWYRAGLKGNQPEMPGEGFSTWDYIGLARYFYQAYLYDGYREQEQEFNNTVQELIEIVEAEHATGRLNQPNIWPWCTLKSGKAWPLSKWIQVNTAAPYRKSTGLIKKYAASL